MVHEIASIGPDARRAWIWIVPVLVLAFSGCAENQTGFDVRTDSSIQLIERSDEGSYRFRSITMLALNGEVTLFTILDEERGESPMPIQTYEALWSFAAQRKVDTMENAPLENAFPGQSQFDFSFRIGGDVNEFSAYGVDFLTDKRYRELAREIIAVSESVSGGGTAPD